MTLWSLAKFNILFFNIEAGFLEELQLLQQRNNNAVPARGTFDACALRSKRKFWFEQSDILRTKAFCYVSIKPPGFLGLRYHRIQGGSSATCCDC